jgi:hypothetical protein
VRPPPSTSESSDGTHSSESTPSVTESSVSDSRSDIDETELSEFLMDTFEGLDAFATTDLPEFLAL